MYTIETEQEADGRWIAEIPELPGVIAYGESRDEAIRYAQALFLRVLADRLEHGEAIPQIQAVFSISAINKMTTTERARRGIFDILSHRYRTGQTDTAARHDDHQP